MLKMYRMFFLVFVVSCLCSYSVNAMDEREPWQPEEIKGKSKRKHRRKSKRSIIQYDPQQNFLMRLPTEIFSYIVKILILDGTSTAISGISSLRKTCKYSLEVADREALSACNGWGMKGLKEDADYPRNLLLPLYFHLKQASIATEDTEAVRHYLTAMKLAEGYGSHLASHGLFHFSYQRNTVLENYNLNEEDFDLIIENLTFTMNYLLKQYYMNKKHKSENDYRSEKNLFEFYCIAKASSRKEEFRNAFLAYPFAKKQLANPLKDGSSSTLWVLFKFETGPFDLEDWADPEFRKNFSSRIDYLKASSEKGYSKAQVYLGKLYEKGWGVEQNFPKAVALYQKAAMQNRAGGLFYLGNMYLHGRGVDKDSKKAVRLFKKASDQGHTTATYYLGWLHQHGEGVYKDIDRAVHLYKEAEAKGSLEAALELVEIYKKGQKVEKDLAQAIWWSIRAAIKGETEALRELGFDYYVGRGVEKDLSEAVRLLKKAAKYGDAKALNTLGWVHEKGFGVQQSYKLAVQFYKQASEMNEQYAKLNLSNCLRYGLGITKDSQKADALKNSVDSKIIQGWEVARKSKGD